MKKKTPSRAGCASILLAATFQVPRTALAAAASDQLPLSVDLLLPETRRGQP